MPNYCMPHSHVDLQPCYSTACHQGGLTALLLHANKVDLQQGLLHTIKVDLQPCSCMPTRWAYSLATALHAIKVDLQPCYCMIRQTATLRANCCTSKSHWPKEPCATSLHATLTCGLTALHLHATHTGRLTVLLLFRMPSRWTYSLAPACH